MDRPIDFSVKPVLTGPVVQLRPFAAEDGERMLQILSDPELRRLTGSVETTEEARRPHSDEEKATIRRWYASRSSQPDRLDLAIIDVAEGDLIGEAVFNEWGPKEGSVNFRILIDPSGQNRGLGTEAIRLFLDYGFRQLGLRRVRLEVLSCNPRAIRVYEKAGFSLEQILPEDFCFDGVACDTLVCSLTRTDHLHLRDHPMV